MTKCYGEMILKKSLIVKYSLTFLFALCLFVLDQWTKHLIELNFRTGQSKILIDKVLRLTYVQNRGAAFGILQGQRVAFLILTVAVFVFAIWYIGKHRPESVLFLSSVGLILSGAAGNAYDRMCLGFVRDFIDVSFINFPVFNVADCAICIGAALLVLHAFRKVEE